MFYRSFCDKEGQQCGSIILYLSGIQNKPSLENQLVSLCVDSTQRRGTHAYFSFLLDFECNHAQNVVLAEYRLSG